MPTGFTADLCERDVPFEEFVWKCVKGMAVAIAHRDDPLDKPIPLTDQPIPYYSNRVLELKIEIERLNSLTDEQIKQEFDEYQKSVILGNQERVDKTDATKKRLESMLLKVREWKPPTDEHIGFKKFMIEQLETTLDFDGTTYTQEVPIDPQLWHMKRVEDSTKSLSFALESQRNELERVKSRNHWKKRLADSVPYWKGN